MRRGHLRFSALIEIQKWEERGDRIIEGPEKK
jgi:hypothetical protein